MDFNHKLTYRPLTSDRFNCVIWLFVLMLVQQLKILLSDDHKTFPYTTKTYSYTSVEGGIVTQKVWFCILQRGREKIK